MKELKLLKKIENNKLDVIKKIKEEIISKRGNLHDWDCTSLHHGWAFWYECKLCGRLLSEDHELTKIEQTEKCPFFDDDFIPSINKLEEYLK
jgi:hypothetical protein